NSRPQRTRWKKVLGPEAGSGVSHGPERGKEIRDYFRVSTRSVRYRIARGPGCAVVSADQPAHPALRWSPQGPSLAPRFASHGEPAPPASRLPEEGRPGPLSELDRPSRAEALSLHPEARPKHDAPAVAAARRHLSRSIGLHSRHYARSPIASICSARHV